MKNKTNPMFVGKTPDDSDYFSSFFFGLTKKDQIEYLKYLEHSSGRKGFYLGLGVTVFVFIIILSLTLS